MSTITLEPTSRHTASAYTYALRGLEAVYALVQRRQTVRELRQLQHELGQLDDRDLRDIGIERHDVGSLVDRGLSRISLNSLR